MRVLKIPIPNKQAFAIRVHGKVLDVLDLTCDIFREQLVINATGESQAKMAVVVFFLIDEDVAKDYTEDHQFVLVKTGDEFPVIDFQIHYTSSTILAMPQENIEFHLFYGGKTDAYKMENLPVGGHA